MEPRNTRAPQAVYFEQSRLDSPSFRSFRFLSLKEFDCQAANATLGMHKRGRMTHLVHLDPLLFEAGDRLGRQEFLARWERMPALRFAELIDGVVYLPSPVSIEHARNDQLLQLWAGLYASRSTVVEALANGTWLMGESAPQPDVALRVRPEFG